MSASTPTIVPAEGVPYAASPYALSMPLPPSARVDLAYVQQVALVPTFVNHSGWTWVCGYTVPAGSIDIVLYASCTVALGATSSSAFNYVGAWPSGPVTDGAPPSFTSIAPLYLFQLPIALTSNQALLQIAATSIATMNVFGAATAGPTVTVPIPVMPLQAGGIFQYLNGGKNTDGYSVIVGATVLRIPSGPQVTQSEGAAVPTPLLV